MTVCVVGCLGNMGRRYGAILRYLNHDACGSDIGEPIPKVDNYIVATPTDTHFDIIVDIKLKNPDARILCEKPVSKKWEEIKALKKYAGSIFMVNNYRFMRVYDNIDDTSYNYYNSGPDGIAWDCIQLLYLAQGSVSLKNESPVWYCAINGIYLDKEDIDFGYIWMLRDWLGDSQFSWGYDDIVKAHKKVLKHLGEFNE